MLWSMANNPQKFLTNVGGEQRRELEFKYSPKDPIFSIAESNENYDRVENQNPTCNSCLIKYKNAKDVRYW